MEKAKFLPLNPRVVQGKLLELLVIVDSICGLHGIPYWIDGGTLLGAVRHQGFIPWDDDLDICLMKPDYDRLLLHLHKEVTNSNELLLFYFGHDEISFWSEYFGTSELLIKNPKGQIRPCRLDISPMKAIRRENEAPDRKITGIANYFNGGRGNHYFNPKGKYHQMDDFEALHEKKIFFDHYNTVYMSAHGKPTTDSLITYSYGDAYSKKERQYFDYADIFPLQEISFEGLRFKCPNKPHEYLTKLYGENHLQPVAPKYQRPINRLMQPNPKNIFRYSQSNLLKDLRESNAYFFNIGKIRYKLKLFISRIRSNGLLSATEAIIRYMNNQFHTTRR